MVVNQTVAHYRKRNAIAEPHRDQLTAMTTSLISSVSAIGTQNVGMAERRQRTLSDLGTLVGADAGWWAWGYDRDACVTPVSLVSFGADAELLAKLISVGLDERLDDEFRLPIRRQMGSSMCQVSIRRDHFSDEEFPRTTFAQLLEPLGFSEWMHAVRYSSPTNWINLLLLRRLHRPPFNADERQVVDLAVQGICWLQAPQAATTIGVSLSGGSPILTARQRTVLAMLLDGKSRKLIARGLEIAEETVGDHIKAIYRAFNVKSAGELAAHFLRSR